MEWKRGHVFHLHKWLKLDAPQCHRYVGLADARLRRQSDGVRTAVRNGVRGASDLAAVAPSIGSMPVR